MLDIGRLLPCFLFLGRTIFRNGFTVKQANCLKVSLKCQGVIWGMWRAVLQLSRSMLFAYSDVAVILFDHRNKNLFLSYRWLSHHLFLPFAYLFRVQRADGRKIRWAQKIQFLPYELWHSWLCQSENTWTYSPCVSAHTAPPDLLSMTPVYFGLAQVWISF